MKKKRNKPLRDNFREFRNPWIKWKAKQYPRIKERDRHITSQSGPIRKVLSLSFSNTLWVACNSGVGVRLARVFFWGVAGGSNLFRIPGGQRSRETAIRRGRRGWTLGRGWRGAAGAAAPAASPRRATPATRTSRASPPTPWTSARTDPASCIQDTPLEIEDDYFNWVMMLSCTRLANPNK